LVDLDLKQRLLDLLCSHNDGAWRSMNGGGDDLLSLLAGANRHYMMHLGLRETAGSLFLLGMESLSLIRSYRLF
jgi:hypothetical protein